MDFYKVKNLTPVKVDDDDDEDSSSSASSTWPPDADPVLADAPAEF